MALNVQWPHHVHLQYVCECQGLDSVDEFMSQLPNYDQEIESQRKEAEAAGEVGLAAFSYVHLNRISRGQMPAC